MRMAFVVLALIMIRLPLAPAAENDTFKIQLTRPYRVGEQLAVSIKANVKSSEKWTGPDNQIKADVSEFGAELAGTETIEAIGDKGRPLRLTVKVTRCAKDGKPLLAAGTTVSAENVNGRTLFKVDGANPTDPVKAVLAELIYTSRVDEPSLGDDFGTDQPRKVGETWAANPEQLAKSASHLPFHVTGDDFTGQGKLVTVETADGKPTQTVKLTDTCAFDTRAGVNGSTYKDLNMKFEETMTIQEDPQSHVGVTKASRTISYTVTATKGTGRIRYERTWEATLSEVGN